MRRPRMRLPGSSATSTTGEATDAPLGRRERVVARSSAGANGPPVLVLATGEALLVGPDPWTRVPWWQVTAATWQPAEGLLHLEVLAPEGPAASSVPVDGDSAVPEVVRERVEASIALSRRVRLPVGGAVRIVARRVPGHGALVWQAVLDRGVDPATPGVAAAVEAALASLRAEVVG